MPFLVMVYTCISGWLCGKEAMYMESLSEEQIAVDCQAILKKFLKKDIPKPNKVLRYGMIERV